VGILVQHGFEGFVEEDDSLRAYIRADQWNDSVLSSLRSSLAEAEKDTGDGHPLCIEEVLEERNWNEDWEKNVREVIIDDAVAIVPSWCPMDMPELKDKMILRIDPKMSFGTGHHETTRLSLRLISRYARPGMEVLDFGSGTAVLAIYALKCGAKHAVAIDNDEWSVENASENAARNGVVDSITILEGSLEKVDDRMYDMICANIDFPTLMRYIPRLCSLCRIGGAIIMSGLLHTDLERIKPVYEQEKYEAIEMQRENEWIALALKRK